MSDVVDLAPGSQFLGYSDVGEGADTLPMRPIAIAATVVLIAGLALRWWLLRSPYGMLNSDEALTGLGAYDVIHGHPGLLIGESVYGGTAESWLAAPFVALLGGSATLLKIVTIIEWLAACGVVAWALRPLFGRARALAVGALLWVQSGAFVLLSTSAYLGYGSGVLCCSAALGCLLRSLQPMYAARYAVLAGLFSGLAVWGHPLFVVPLLPAMLAAWWLQRGTAWRGWLTRVVVGGLVGASPLLTWNVLHRGASLKPMPQVRVTTYRERLEIIFAQLTPRSFGLRIPDGGWLYPRRLGMAAVAIILVLGLAGLVVLARRRRHGLVLAAAGLPALPFIALFPNAWYADDGRYFLPVSIGLFTGLVSLTLLVNHRRRFTRNMVSVGLGLAVLTWGLCSCGPWFRRLVPRHPSDPEVAVRTAVERLDAAHIRGVAGEYWAVYRIAYRADARIAAAVQAGPNRFHRQQVDVENMPAASVAYVYLDYADHPDEVPNNAVGYERVVVSPFILYLPSSR
jgi:hypothetical protein